MILHAVPPDEQHGSRPRRPVHVPGDGRRDLAVRIGMPPPRALRRARGRHALGEEAQVLREERPVNVVGRHDLGAGGRQDGRRRVRETDLVEARRADEEGLEVGEPGRVAVRRGKGREGGVRGPVDGEEVRGRVLVLRARVQGLDARRGEERARDGAEGGGWVGGEVARREGYELGDWV